jgi:hypothetical protein
MKTLHRLVYSKELCTKPAERVCVSHTALRDGAGWIQEAVARAVNQCIRAILRCVRMQRISVVYVVAGEN